MLFIVRDRWKIIDNFNELLGEERFPLTGPN